MSETVWLSGARGFVGEYVRRSFLDAMMGKDKEEDMDND